MIFVRATSAEPARGHPPRDLAADGGAIRLTAETEVARRESGPFAKLAVAIERDGRLRDQLARALPIPSLQHHRELRAAVAVLALVPAALVVELDRRALPAHSVGTGGAATRLAGDLLLGGYVAFELGRPTPRIPGIAAVALFAMALRGCLFATSLCGHERPWFAYFAPLAATVGALLLLVRAPTRSRVCLELLDRLGITREQARAAASIEPPTGPLVGFSVAAAVALPVLLYLLRTAHVTIPAQGAVVLTYAVVVPPIARRAARPRSSSAARPSSDAPSPLAIAWGIVVGLALTSALMTAARSFFDTGTALAQCVGRLDDDARRLAAREAAETAAAVARARASMPFFAFTALLLPFAEERIHRGLLQDALVRKYGRAYGVFATAMLFAVAHVGVYELGVYQTVLLGIGLGVAYLEGGLFAAVVVHAAWNLARLV